MTTITIDDDSEFSKKHFANVEELQEYLLLEKQKAPLSYAHKQILDERIQELKDHPQDSLTREEGMKQIRRNRTK